MVDWGRGTEADGGIRVTISEILTVISIAGPAIVTFVGGVWWLSKMFAAVNVMKSTLDNLFQEVGRLRTGEELRHNVLFDFIRGIEIRVVKLEEKAK